MGNRCVNSGFFRLDFSKYGEAICGFGKIEMFLGDFRGIAGRVLKAGKRFSGMRRKGFKGRIEKRMIGKCTGVFRAYDAIQSAYADVLERDEDIREIRCNVLLEGLTEGEYTSDFVCVRKDGDMMVRECVQRKLLLKPMTVRLLDASREYWLRRGVTDWGLVVDAER